MKTFQVRHEEFYGNSQQTQNLQTNTVKLLICFNLKFLLKLKGMDTIQRINFAQTFKICLLGHYELKIATKIWGHHLSKKVRWCHTLFDILPKS